MKYKVIEDLQEFGAPFAYKKGSYCFYDDAELLDEKPPTTAEDGTPSML